MASIVIELDDGRALVLPKEWFRQALSVWKMHGKCPSCNNEVKTRCICQQEPKDMDRQYFELSQEQLITYLRISTAPVSAKELAQGLAVAEYLGDDVTLAKYASQ